ncbi:MAG: molybdopterin adenylyltransferase [Runella slithyformis]|nr:MAG: molybdopterin adenylyltransferase [Runella slithyformis]TAE98147.1 MAG: molybdopterin adenylyltransferase [Runella slithyformis]TAF28277.1 MAG: molybdopterin adenylyltransferase [Runella slithyformis]TAF46966.1 MAG: molybdopterin adenylyltransferase [Runella slithyformis]TAF83092.1 MAG: molybdopterin adenylyltransferase [Runella slithyformis]
MAQIVRFEGLVGKSIHGKNGYFFNKFTEVCVQIFNTVQTIKIGIINVSDRASAGIYEDIPGKAIVSTLNEYLSVPWEAVYRVVPDEQALISETLCQMADDEGCCLIVTSGGTGPAVRDVTPEATEAVCQKMLPGFGELMRQVSLQYVPTAILSRQTAGIRGGALIINLPGKPSAIRQCLDAVFPAVPYCIDLIDGPYLATNEAVMKVFRPKS